jgi:hypothetical protein
MSWTGGLKAKTVLMFSPLSQGFFGIGNQAARLRIFLHGVEVRSLKSSIVMSDGAPLHVTAPDPHPPHSAMFFPLGFAEDLANLME